MSFSIDSKVHLFDVHLFSDTKLLHNVMGDVAQSTPATVTLINAGKKNAKEKTDWHSLPGCINNQIEKTSNSMAVAVKGAVVLAGTHLSKAETEQARKLAKLLGGSFHAQVMKHTTHLITPVSGNLMAKRTLKYIQALSIGCWVVSTGWMELSVMIGARADESQFEVNGDTDYPTSNGPRKSREEVSNHC